MKNLLLITFAILCCNFLSAQVMPNKKVNHQRVDIKQVELKQPKTFETNVIVIDGSVYKDLCVPANKPGGDCQSFKNAWVNGYLSTCTNGEKKLVPYHTGDSFKCYESGGIIHVRITPNSAFRTTRPGATNN